MPLNSNYTLILFYSNSNQQSLRVRVAINEFVSENIEFADMSVKEIDYDKNTMLAREYRIFGTPAIVVISDTEVVRRHLGEITIDELKAMVTEF